MQDDSRGGTIFPTREDRSAAAVLPEVEQAYPPQRALRYGHLRCHPPCTCWRQLVHDRSWDLQHVSWDWEKGVKFRAVASISVRGVEAMPSKLWRLLFLQIILLKNEAESISSSLLLVFADI